MDTLFLILGIISIVLGSIVEIASFLGSVSVDIYGKKLTEYRYDIGCVFEPGTRQFVGMFFGLVLIAAGIVLLAI